MTSRDFDVDTREIAALSLTFQRSPANLGKDIVKVTEVAAMKTKVAAQGILKGAVSQRQRDTSGRFTKSASGPTHLPYIANSIDYDIRPIWMGVSAEVGYNKDKPQGPLGNIVEFGTSKNAPLPALLPAFDAEVPVWQRLLEAIVAKGAI